MLSLHPTSFLFLFFTFWQVPLEGYVVKGKILLGDEWEPKIYLSAVSSFDNLNTASEDFIVQVADINSDGSFKIIGSDLPPEDRLYRIHVCKKGDPPATLFIGGKEENHIHFVMNNSSEIDFESDSIFRDAKIEGHPANLASNQLREKLNSFRQALPVNSKINRERRQNQKEEFLINFLDTCSESIPAMLAMKELDVEELTEERPEFLNAKMNEWAGLDASSPYLNDLQKRIDIYRHNNRRTGKSWLMEGLLVCGILLFFFLFRKKLSEREETFKPEAELSVQERKVLRLVSGGKSNKEISEELHIEVSTVKSHVSKIYSKLGVRSRKEVIGKY